MAAIERHSTRIMGFHLRELQTARGDESEMYSAQIFHGDVKAGTARNEGNGGSDLVRIDPAHREAWERLVRYMEEHPLAVREDGSREEYHSGEEAATALLRDIHDADARLYRSRKFRSALLGYRWDKPFPSGGWWAEGRILFSPDSGIPLDTVPGDLFHIVVIGADSARFARETAPPVPGSGGPKS